MVQSCETIYPPILLTSKSLAVPAFDISQDQLVHKVMHLFKYCFSDVTLRLTWLHESFIICYQKEHLLMIMFVTRDLLTNLRIQNK